MIIGSAAPHIEYKGTLTKKQSTCERFKNISPNMHFIFEYLIAKRKENTFHDISPLFLTKLIPL